jgi:AraC family transcriptional regulator of adaptative response / DNA-3-methyladenine glycosylase II
MAEDALATPRLSDVADSLGITDRHLRRVFVAEYGVSPVQYLQTQRLLLAKSLLTDTGLSVTDVAMYAGFGSIRRFNDLFKTYYRLAPSRFRRMDGKAQNNSDEITLSLGYRPPYAWEALISFLAGRAIPGVESVAGNVYQRTVAIKQGAIMHRGWISVSHRPQKHSLSVTVAASLLPVLTQVLARARRLFDTDCNPMEIAGKLAVMNELSPELFVPGTRLPGCFDPFEMAVRAVLGQQVTVKAARTLSGRLAAGFGEAITTPFAELTVTFPGPERICALGHPIEDCLGPLGITGARSRSILALAEALSARSIVLAHYVDAEQEMEKLLRLPGFGPWTVQYIAMRALGWPDAFPHTDYGVKKALADHKPQEILETAQAWSPWRSYATIALWNSLSKDVDKS